QNGWGHRRRRTAGHRREDGQLRALGDRGVGGGLVGADEDVDVAAEGARFVPDATADARVGGRQGIDDVADGGGRGGGRGHVDLDRRRPASVGPQRGGQADDDDQRSTAALTHSTGGRWRASSLHVSPPSADPYTSPVRVPTYSPVGSHVSAPNPSRSTVR